MYVFCYIKRWWWQYLPSLPSLMLGIYKWYCHRLLPSFEWAVLLNMTLSTKLITTHSLLRLVRLLHLKTFSLNNNTKLHWNWSLRRRLVQLLRKPKPLLLPWPLPLLWLLLFWLQLLLLSLEWCWILREPQGVIQMVSKFHYLLNYQRIIQHNH